MANCSSTIEILRRTARRWAGEHFAPIGAELERQWCPELPASIMGELSERGWLPSQDSEVNDWSPLLVARLGQALGEAASAVFVPILTHVLALHLSKCTGQRAVPVDADSVVLATSPYWDFSKVPPPVRVEPSGGSWVLNGRLPLVVNGHAASFLVVPAQLPGGIPVICGVQLNQAGVIQSKSIPQLGLRGAAARNILFSSVVVTEGSFYCQGALATSTLQNAFGMLGWGVIGMLSGLIAKALAEAKDYAGLRMQGGRRIIDHRPVAELLSVACSAEDLLKSWVNQLGELGDSDTPPQPPLKEAGRTAIRATEATLQVFGGNGYICPGIAERCWRDARQAAALCSEAGCPCE